MAGGRPSKYSDKVINRICRETASGQSLVKICKAKDMPCCNTVRNWLSDPEHVEFLRKYTRAREEQADHYADQIIEIADTVEDPQKAKIMIDARKWVASKLKAKSYGDKVTQEHTGPAGGPISLQVEFIETLNEDSTS